MQTSRRKHDKRKKKRLINFSVSFMVFLMIGLLCHTNSLMDSGIHHSNGKVLSTPATFYPIDLYLKSSHFSGTALIVKDGKMVLHKSYGLSHRAKKIINEPNTQYYIASLTKAFVSTAIMQLEEQGKLTREDRLAKYFPKFPHATEIKIKHLLSQTSGISRRNEKGGKLTKHELMKDISRHALTIHSKPGETWEYTDSNYSLLGLIIEKASGMSLHEYITKFIFKPLGMEQSGFGDAAKKDSSLSIGYQKRFNFIYSPTRLDFSQLFGSGDSYSTAYDLYKFDHALITGKLIDRSSVRKLFTPTKNRYGYGWYIHQKNYSIHGHIPGWSGINSISKDGKDFIVLLSNLQSLSELKNIYAEIEKGVSAL
ncbi:serine hydrolase domain-containing protein [Heyndrickxia vini]|uniref:Beta-lactamase family protein n=1 Tax=Heyndrickxia vini TaxID=1476025 RepID=A0ABX7DYT7_9BACI|nr:serine hydrolase domain-containing protein [Heyndrickxia vini]QQZ08634.1 beta-lactamase family protein [Heyndrickxia vini]